MKLGLILDLNKLHSKRHHNSCTLHRYTHVTALFSMKIRYLAVLLSIILWITVWPLLKTRYFSFIFTKLLKRIFSATGTNATDHLKNGTILVFRDRLTRALIIQCISFSWFNWMVSVCAGYIPLNFGSLCLAVVATAFNTLYLERCTKSIKR